MLLAVTSSPPRAKGAVRARFERAGDATQVARLFETGGLRLRFPRSHSDCEAVLINTGGGVVGGDEMRLSFQLGARARTMITTQSAEKIYRSDGAESRIETKLDLGPAALLDWLPQETILFDGARLRRSLDVDMAGDADALLLESVVFGRLAMQEACRAGDFRDSWRVRRDNRLVFAEETAFGGDIAAALDRSAIGKGARACATLLMVSPGAQARLDGLREALGGGPCAFGASAQDGFLAARFLSAEPSALRAALVVAIKTLRGHSTPRVWQ